MVINRESFKFLTYLLENTLVFNNNAETIDTGHPDNQIGSIEFIKSENSNKILLVGGCDSFGLQIYHKINNKYVFKNKLWFEDKNTFSSTITTNKYMFVKA